MNILLFSTLYPNKEEQRNALFVERRLLNLLKDTDVTARVVAPVPWFPIKHSIFKSYAKFAKVPHKETRSGVTIYHPRYLVIPKIGMALTPFFMFLGTFFLLRRLSRDEKGFDLIDSHFLYPDGMAAILLGKLLKKPVTITCRGSDVTLHVTYKLPFMIARFLIDKADHVITVCEALKTELIRLRLDNAPISVLRNGIDLDFFHEVDRISARDRLGFSRKTIISVGHLIKRKGHDLVISALLDLEEVDLVIIGEGEEEKNLKKLVAELNLSDRVTFTGSLSPDSVREYYSAADVLVLASAREGWANVLLESMACGTPVVATKIWGTPEVVNTPVAGKLVEERNPQCIARAVQELLKDLPNREETRRYTESFDWKSISLAQHTIFSRLVNC